MAQVSPQDANLDKNPLPPVQSQPPPVQGTLPPLHPQPQQAQVPQAQYGQPGTFPQQQPGVPGGVPGPAVWMPAVAPSTSCPPGMEYLTQLDQVLVQQETSLMEVLTGWECKNKFKVLNNMGQQVYYAFEESSICQRMCCGPERGFTMHITDNMQQEVFRVVRDFKWCSGAHCLPCEACRYYASVQTRDGQILGYISNLVFCCSPVFGVFDAEKNIIAEIQGPCCPYQFIGCTKDIDFPVTNVADGSHMGSISKQWEGLLKNMFTDSDNFSIRFPMDLDVRKKALLFGATFVIDMMVYETQQNNNNNGWGGGW